MSEERLTRIEQNLQAFRDEIRTDYRSEFTGVNARLDGHDRRFDEVDRRLDEVVSGQHEMRVDLEAKIASTKSEVLAQFEELKDNFKVVAEAQHSLAEAVEKGFADIPRLIAKELSLLDGAVRGHTTQLINHEGRIEKLEARR